MTTDIGNAILYTLKDVSGLPSFAPGTGSDLNPADTTAMTVSISGAPNDPNIATVEVLDKGK
ncbi:hypothetical protein, partial [Arthrobacter sp. 260]|uniref:hypothetical protein n=1 Tax=Arthrobacter sp. 260 TaxID=2735314 RepID=UPI0014932152